MDIVNREIQVLIEAVPLLRRKMQELEQRTGFMLLHQAYAIMAFVVYYLLFGNDAHQVCNLLIILFPMQESVSAMSGHKLDLLKLWISYWILFALGTVIEGTGQMIREILPMYYLLKLEYHVYLWHPTSFGFKRVYERLVKPVMSLMAIKFGADDTGGVVESDNEALPWQQSQVVDRNDLQQNPLIIQEALQSSEFWGLVGSIFDQLQSNPQIGTIPQAPESEMRSLQKSSDSDNKGQSEQQPELKAKKASKKSKREKRNKKSKRDEPKKHKSHKSRKTEENIPLG